MEKIEFDNTSFIWKTKLNLIEDKSIFLKESYDIIQSKPENKTDGFPFLDPTIILDFDAIIPIHRAIDNVLKMSVQSCIELYKTKSPIFNNLIVNSWVNVVRATNPKQYNFNPSLPDIGLHRHIDINKNFHTTYTFVYYIQMPDNLKGNEGTLIIGGEKERYYYLPKEDDLIIMTGELPHSPNISPNSSKDRIVIAGNVGIDYIKKKTTLI
jgi:hypothetical protein